MRFAAGPGLLLLCALLCAAAGGVPQTGASAAEQEAERLADQLESADWDRSAPGAREILSAAYESWTERMESYDAGSSVRLARAMFRAEPAVWSVFALEGALRRTAPADLDGAEAAAAYDEADAALATLLTPRTSRADAIALHERRAILAAGFGRPDAERRHLGASLGRGGLDSAQIVAFDALARSVGNTEPADLETAHALFASLLDRSRTAAPADTAPPVSAPWALRGHGLAALEAALR